MSVCGTDVSRSPLRAFLARRLYVTRAVRRPPSAWALGLRLRLYTAIHKTAHASFRCPSRLQRSETGRECSPVVHRLRLWGLALGSASPCADCHGAGNLRLTVCGVLTRICAYSVRHPHFRSLQRNGSPAPSSLPERSPTPDAYASRPSFGGPLNPDHSRRIPTGLVSYYALFKGVAASKPTSQLSK